MKILRILCLILLPLTMPVHALAENFYQVSLLRASPGQLPALIELAKDRKNQLKGDMIIMRHSQGDHWDLMLLMPASENFPLQFSYQKKVDFQHDFLASSESDWTQVKRLSDASELFHIEMFHAASNLYPDLLAQRRMENNYLLATQRNANLIFETVFGSDVDLFTVGFYASMQAFAAEPELTDEVFEKAATDAGFSARSDIGFYLRRFLVSHQDTLASHVK